MPRRKKRRPPEKAATVEYRDEEGNTLVLRQSLSRLTIRKIGQGPSSAAASVDDAWRRRSELLFERLAVSWEIAGLPITDQKMLLGRYRMADSDDPAVGQGNDRDPRRAAHPRARRLGEGAQWRERLDQRPPAGADRGPSRG